VHQRVSVYVVRVNLKRRCFVLFIGVGDVHGAVVRTRAMAVTKGVRLLDRE